eukprot:GHVU01087750.1.p1 GENE.GHVU01087750.1~~GHVU01087750.1.p1  ORF type:complete len:395 (-),score=106.80 GHVU01087750.1:1491-2675(-)
MISSSMTSSHIPLLWPRVSSQSLVGNERTSTTIVAIVIIIMIIISPRLRVRAAALERSNAVLRVATRRYEESASAKLAAIADTCAQLDQPRQQPQQGGVPVGVQQQAAPQGVEGRTAATATTTTRDPVAAQPMPSSLGEAAVTAAATGAAAAAAMLAGQSGREGFGGRGGGAEEEEKTRTGGGNDAPPPSSSSSSPPLTLVAPVVASSVDSSSASTSLDIRDDYSATAKAAKPRSAEPGPGEEQTTRGQEARGSVETGGGSEDASMGAGAGAGGGGGGRLQRRRSTEGDEDGGSGSGGAATSVGGATQRPTVEEGAADAAHHLPTAPCGGAEGAAATAGPEGTERKRGDAGSDSKNGGAQGASIAEEGSAGKKRKRLRRISALGRGVNEDASAD